MPDTTIDYKLKHDHLAKKVKEMLAAQKAYFKSNKDFQLLKVSKALEKEVDELVNPKPPQAPTLFSEEFLGR